MDQKRVVIGRAILALGLLLLLLPLARWGVAFYWQQQVLRQIDSQPWKSTPLEEFINARIAARWQESPAQEPDQIEIPKIGLKAAILPGVTPADLKLGPGLYPQSAPPKRGTSASLPIGESMELGFDTWINWSLAMRYCSASTGGNTHIAYASSLSPTIAIGA